MKQVDVHGLALGDTVKQFEGAFGTAVVTKITDEAVTLFRPYGVTADFAYSAGSGAQVIPYTGFEMCIYYLNSCTQLFEVYSSKRVQ